MLTAALKNNNPFGDDDLTALGRTLELEEAPLPRLLRLSIVVLALAVVTFIVWAALTPVKELVRTEGQVIPSGYTQLVQHLEGGLVREILVHEGDLVKKGQPLMRIDGAGTQEDYNEQQALAISLALQAERLNALLEDRMPVFSSITTDKLMTAEQQRMFDSSKMARATERTVLQDQIAQKEAALARLQQGLPTAQENLDIAREAHGIYEKLAKQGHTTRPMLLKRQEELNTSRGQLESLQSQASEAKSALNEYRQRLQTLMAQQRDTTFAELQIVQTELAQARELLKKRQDRLNRLELKAPAAGYVKGLRVNTIGAVIPTGQTIMEIVPVDETLVIELRIPPEQIGRVAVGQPVQVKVDSYDYVRYGTIPGTLTSISATTFTDELKRVEYYRARVRLEQDYVGKIAGRHPIIPGMTVDSDIVIGEKSVLAYLLKPIRSALYNALTEQ